MAKATTRGRIGDTEKKGGVGSKHKRKVTSQGSSKNTRLKNKSKKRLNGNTSRVK